MLIGRYALQKPFATGGMASVHFGRLAAPGGFQKTVAIKVPHESLARDPEFRAMFLDEARIASCIRSEYVVETLDVLEVGDNIYQVMEYAHGPPLSALCKRLRARSEEFPISMLIAIVVDVLEGLHAAHEARDASGAPLSIVHRDVSPQNVIVVDSGLAKVLDFGVASASGKLHLTQPGDVKGKISYMAPEQVEARPLDRRADVYAAGVMLFEALTGRRPFVADDVSSIAVKHVLEMPPDPRQFRADVSEQLAAIIACALEKQPRARYSTARAMAEALLALPTPRATTHAVADWLREAASEWFDERAAQMNAAPETDTTPTVTPVSTTRSPAPRRTFVWVTGGTLLGATIAVAAIGAWTSYEARPRAASRAEPPVIAKSTASARETSIAVAAVTSAPDTQTSASAQIALPPSRQKPPRPRDHAGDVRDAATIPLPPCCAGDLRLRMTGCADNCPRGDSTP